MKGGSKRVVWVVTAVSLAALAGQAEAGNLVNPDCEAGGFSGWTVTIPTGTSEFSGVQPAGTAQVLGSFSPNASIPSIVPHGGNYFAAVGSADFAFFGLPSLTYNITACQTVSLAAGETVSGWAAFYNGDYAAQDTAFVGVFDSNDQAIATPWAETSGSISSGGTAYQSVSGWSLWQWEAPTDGDYTLKLGMSTFGDDTLASYGFFDDIQVTTVPEPSALALLGSGATGLICLRRKSDHRATS